MIGVAELVGKEDLPIAEMSDSVKLVLIVVVHAVLFHKKETNKKKPNRSLFRMKTEEESVAH